VEESVVVAAIAGPMPLREIPRGEDVAESAVFLCSDRSRMITGQTLYVDSGNHMT
jgi:3-oxoacyl-[acyl-carrier protein] reductase